MEIIEIYRMPDEAYNKNEPWGIQNIENVEFDGKDKLPENLKAVLEEYITVTDGTDYWAAVGKNTVDIILNVVKEFIPDFTMEFDEVYRGNLYANVDIDKLIEYAKNSDDFIIGEETINDKLAFEVIDSLLRKSSHFKDNIFLELMTEAVNQRNVYKCLKIDLEQFIEDYDLVFEPDIIDIDELQYYATDDEKHYHWINDAPGQQKLDFKYEGLLKERLNNVVYKGDKMDSNSIKNYIKKLSETTETDFSDILSGEKLDTLDDVISVCKNPNISADQKDDFVEEVIMWATENHADVVKLWGEIEGDTENDEEIIKLMLSDLREYIHNEV